MMVLVIQSAFPSFLSFQKSWPSLISFLSFWPHSVIQVSFQNSVSIGMMLEWRMILGWSWLLSLAAAKTGKHFRNVSIWYFKTSLCPSTLNWRPDLSASHFFNWNPTSPELWAKPFSTFFTANYKKCQSTYVSNMWQLLHKHFWRFISSQVNFQR